MLNRNKKTIVFALILLISFSSASYFIPKTESIDPFFTLVAVGSTPTHMDYLNLIKQQLKFIGVNIDIKLQDFSWQPPELLAFRDFDLQILEIKNESYFDPFFSDFYRENGSYNLFGYHTSMDWDDELNTGRNEWYIKSGQQMILNDTQEQKEFCWEWQNYLMDKILPCLPLFTRLDDNSTFEILVFNTREVRPVIGNRDPAPGYYEYSIGNLIRKAISYAINREEIRRVVLGEDYKIIDHPINPFLGNWCNPNIIRYCHDIDVARRYFTSAGYDVGCGHLDPNYVDTFPDWSNWDAVCSRNDPNKPTIDVAGFTLVITCLAVSTTKIAFTTFHFKRKRKLNKGWE